MKVDVAKFIQFYEKLDYEGGVEAYARYGAGDSGDVKLNTLMEELDGVLLDIDSRLVEINNDYKNEIDAYYAADDAYNREGV